MLFIIALSLSGRVDLPSSNLVSSALPIANSFNLFALMASNINANSFMLHVLNPPHFTPTSFNCVHREGVMVKYYLEQFPSNLLDGTNYH